MTSLRHPESGETLFTASELKDPDTGTVKLADGFAERLIELRVLFNKPIIVTSCCRSAKHNAKVKGHPRSLHVWDHNAHGLNGCAAIDVRVGPAPIVREFVCLAIRHGWSVGVARWFIHLDRRELAGIPAGVFGYG